jgi:hypothetical protein
MRLGGAQPGRQAAIGVSQRADGTLVTGQQPRGCGCLDRPVATLPFLRPRGLKESYEADHMSAMITAGVVL